MHRLRTIMNRIDILSAMRSKCVIMGLNADELIGMEWRKELRSISFHTCWLQFSFNWKISCVENVYSKRTRSNGGYVASLHLRSKSSKKNCLAFLEVQSKFFHCCCCGSCCILLMLAENMIYYSIHGSPLF